MSHVDTSPLSMYNSLSDPHLAGYFANTKMRNHLRRSGLITRRGEIVPENSYRMNMARKEHKKHVKDLLAHAIVQKTLDLERHRQVAIRQKLEEIAKIELVQRVKDDRKINHYSESLLPLLTPRKGKGQAKGQGNTQETGSPGRHQTPSPHPEDNVVIEERTQKQRRNDEDLLPYISPRSSRPHSGPSPRSHRSNRSSKYRPISAPSNMPDTNSSMYESNDEDADVTYVDDHGNPVEWSELDTSRGRSRTPRSWEEIDARHLYSLNPAALRRYATTLARMEQTSSLVSPYLMPQVPIPPSSPRSAPHRHRGYRTRSASSDKSPKRSPGHDLHRQEPPMSHQGDIHSMCEVTMKYHGWALNLAREKIDPRQEIQIEQQHCGGNTLTVFRDKLVPGSTFTFTSKRHRGYPFSLTLYVDGRQDARVSTCCELGHSRKVRLGGKQGHFSIVKIAGMSPCYKCQVQKGLRGTKAPPKKLKHPAKGETGEEVIVVDTVAKEQTPQRQDDTHPAEPEDESAIEQILVPVEPEGQEPGGADTADEYEDDFDEEDEKEEPDEDDSAEETGVTDDAPISPSKCLMVLYDKSWDSEKKDKDERGVPDKTVEMERPQTAEEKRKIRMLSDELEDNRGQKETTVPAEKSTTPSKLDEYIEEKDRKVEGYSSEEEDLEGERSKTVEVEKKPDTPVKSNQRREETRDRMKTPPRHPRILSPPVAQEEESDAHKTREEDDSIAIDITVRTRTPSPPQVQTTKVTPMKVEDRDADYSSSSESSTASSSSSEDEITPRPATQKQEDTLPEESKSEPEKRVSLPVNQTAISSDRSTFSESSIPTASSSSSSASDTETKAASQLERPKSPVAMTLLREEEEEQKLEQSETLNSQKVDSPVHDMEEKIETLDKMEAPVTDLVEEQIVTKNEVEEAASHQTPLEAESKRSEPESVISKGRVSVSPRVSSISSSSESSSESDTEKPSVQKIENSENIKENLKKPDPESSSRSSSSESDTGKPSTGPSIEEPLVQKIETSEDLKEDLKKTEPESSTSSSSGSSSSGSESERSTNKELLSEPSHEKNKAAGKDSSDSDSSSQHDNKNQAVIIASPPDITTTAETVQAPAVTKSHTELSGGVQEQKEAKTEESVANETVDETPAAPVDDAHPVLKKKEDSDTDGGVKKSEDSDSVDSSSDSASSSSSSSDESESEGELIVQSDTPQQDTARTQQSDSARSDTDAQSKMDSTARTDADTTARTETDITARTETETARTESDINRTTESVQTPQGENNGEGQQEVEEQAEEEDKARLPSPHGTVQSEQTSLLSQPSTPPRSPKQEGEAPHVPAVVVIPNTPEITDIMMAQERQDVISDRVQSRSGGPPGQFEYKPKRDSTTDDKGTDEEGQQRLQSESEPETMHGGNDPDNVAENDSANWHGSMEFAGPPEQTTHQGSLTTLLDDQDDIQINNINLTKSQIVELLQKLESKDTAHTLSISNANLGMEEIQMLCQSLAKSSAKPTVLNLNYNILGPTSANTLVDILQVKPSIEMLLLQGNPIGDKGLQVLVDGLLDIEYEAQEYKKKESQQQGGVPITLPRGRFCQIRELDIGEASITDEGMVDVALLLESNLELQTLSLSSSPDITQSGWTKLGLSLAKNRKLKTLTLEHNKIGDAGILSIVDGLQGNTSLTTLDLADSRIGEEGARAIVDLLKRNTTLLNVTLSPGNNISEKTREEIQRYLALNQASASSP